MGAIDYSERIPNNVNLSNDRRLQRALEAWQPEFLNWWQEMGPAGFQANDIYLRTAMSADTQGWANYGYVKMPDYRWGIFLAAQDPQRQVNFGEHKGQPVWQKVPGEQRAMLRRLVVIQGDTEPASVEQQRLLGQTCPSLYDLRNLFQVNVEEGRHLWAMVYLLHAYFGRDGREEAEGLLTRRSGDTDKPRMLETFNEETPDWLAFFMFTFFTDRDGKFQLSSLAESGFDPLARTCRFMLTEEAYHMFVGEHGVSRIIKRTCEIMEQNNSLGPDTEIRRHGVIDLPTIQKYLNFHFSLTLDLFGAEISTNAATAYTAGIKGRYRESKLDGDHVLTHNTYPVLQYSEGAFRRVEQPALNSLNERLRDDFINECAKGINRWNKIIEKAGIAFTLSLPERTFNRHIGEWAELNTTPQGDMLSDDQWQRRKSAWLPTDEDRAYVRSLMSKAVITPGRYAHWIAPPIRSTNNQSHDFEYVRFN